MWNNNGLPSKYAPERLCPCKSNSEVSVLAHACNLPSDTGDEGNRIKTFKARLGPYDFSAYLGHIDSVSANKTETILANYKVAYTLSIAERIWALFPGEDYFFLLSAFLSWLCFVKG